MSWIDVVLVLLLAAFIALGSHRRLSGLLLGIGGVLMLRPLLLIGTVSPVLAVAGALGVGLVLGVVARWVTTTRPLPEVPMAILGGVGGAALGLSLVLASAVSLPLQENATGQLVYPPQQGLPGYISPAVQRSRIIREGRDILLYPLLDRQGDVADARRPVLRTLHNYLVVGEPWEGR